MEFIVSEEPVPPADDGGHLIIYIVPSVEARPRSAWPCNICVRDTYEESLVAHGQSGCVDQRTRGVHIRTTSMWTDHKFGIGRVWAGTMQQGSMISANQRERGCPGEEHARKAASEAERSSDFVCALHLFQCSPTWCHKETARGRCQNGALLENVRVHSMRRQSVYSVVMVPAS